MSALKNSAEHAARPGGARRSPETTTLILSVCVATLVLELAVPAAGQQATSLNGPPVQVVPTASEPGIPTITISAGTPNPFPGSGGAGTGGTGTGGTGTGGTGGGNVGDSSALSTMLGTSWGATAIANAQALGLNPSALAATCVMESGCTQPGNGGGAQGVFQMFPAAFHDGLATALAANPDLASQIVQGPGGVNDPTTAAIAASGYLMQAGTALQNAGISNPTVLDTRTYYQFGPTYGPKVATADGSTTLGTLVPQSWLASNGLSSSTTVAQWQSTITAKVGNAASQTLRI